VLLHLSSNTSINTVCALECLFASLAVHGLSSFTSDSSDTLSAIASLLMVGALGESFLVSHATISAALLEFSDASSAVTLALMVGAHLLISAGS
jgi:hypothetical protein